MMEIPLEVDNGIRRQELGEKKQNKKLNKKKVEEAEEEQGKEGKQLQENEGFFLSITWNAGWILAKGGD